VTLARPEKHLDEKRWCPSEAPPSGGPWDGRRLGGLFVRELVGHFFLNSWTSPSSSSSMREAIGASKAKASFWITGKMPSRTSELLGLAATIWRH
jgi:hypothetical protein